MHRTSLLALLLCAGPALSLASDRAAPEWELSLAAGHGVLENPLAGRADGETNFLPSFSYYGDRFFISNLAVGYSLLEERNFYVDLVARPNEDGLYYHLDDSEMTMGSLSFALGSAGGFGPQLEPIERDISLMAGPSVTLVGKYADLSLASFHDVTAVHYGSETHLSLDKVYPLFGGKLGLSLGAIKKDADLIGYYYHVTEAEGGMMARSFARQSPPEDVVDTYGRLHFSYPLTRNVEFRLGARYQLFDEEGRNPMVLGKSETMSWFAGFQYRFGSDR
ncbi:MipA/OmpV family protein [Microbulbifer hydrolyticus]|uniref:Outer membrane scaffolding protein for murein synthesis (MipA/OmpV family) n=1 Tax=Microbulbifer hydrolyticus TaxID=48074 RepID=A0A6P1T7L2_9GAMM|nr:MipA/OmpV family protein [Microbulbifer hydrolyticus]MBB5211577.1 outer membrane scaffolding protein for murein synthesis (MipA/OmpV family) [Microbulbifer hydrolyticus]QHQ37683.1 hypothetical protein GTQ55_00915 [Microbulbifer hydrolyticus]